MMRLLFTIFNHYDKIRSDYPSGTLHAEIIRDLFVFLYPNVQYWSGLFVLVEKVWNVVTWYPYCVRTAFMQYVPNEP